MGKIDLEKLPKLMTKKELEDNRAIPYFGGDCFVFCDSNGNQKLYEPLVAGCYKGHFVLTPQMR